MVFLLFKWVVCCYDELSVALLGCLLFWCACLLFCRILICSERTYFITLIWCQWLRYACWMINIFTTIWETNNRIKINIFNILVKNIKIAHSMLQLGQQWYLPQSQRKIWCICLLHVLIISWITAVVVKILKVSLTRCCSQHVFVMVETEKQTFHSLFYKVEQ